MPATFTAPHSAPAPVVSVAELSPWERVVALYASDMPTQFRMGRKDIPQVVAWIVQGVARLGLEELYRSAAYAYGHRLLWMADRLTSEQTAAHRRRFPKASRFDRADRTAAAFTCFSGIVTSEAAKERGRRPLVEGACGCRETGWIQIDFGDGVPVSQACPGHNPEGRSDLAPAKSSAPLAVVA